MKFESYKTKEKSKELGDLNPSQREILSKLVRDALAGGNRQAEHSEISDALAVKLAEAREKQSSMKV